MANSDLGAAKKAKEDEFYTLWVDIEREMNAYLEFDPDTFRGKTVLLPCDDPEWSNFTKFFALHFTDFGLKKLISTSYAPNSNAAGKFYAPTLFEVEDPGYDPDKSMERGRVFTLVPEDVSGDGRVDIDDLRWEYLEGDGDFRSPEVTALRDEADIVITNGPFSLFRAFMEWVAVDGVQYSILGNSNAITYKEMFPLIRDNLMWLGATRNGSGQMWFRVPDSAPKKTGQKVVDGVRYQTVGNTAWFTNIEHGRRHEPLRLMSETDNVKFSRFEAVRGIGYLSYDNYDAIDVPKVEAIPADHHGVMGVPITFLGKYNPDQFEIVGITKTWDDAAGWKTKVYPTQTQVAKKTRVETQVSKLNDGASVKVSEPPTDDTYYIVDGELFVQRYARILIRHRTSEPMKG